jgi:hypothetical protein
VTTEAESHRVVQIKSFKFKANHSSMKASNGEPHAGNTLPSSITWLGSAQFFAIPQLGE